MALFALFAPACKDEQRLRREEALKQTLAQMRRAIAGYRADHGTYPKTLEALVPKYLARIPVDPVSQSTHWRVTTEETVQPSSDFQTTTAEAPASVVIDVHSGAEGMDRNGVPYANY